MGGSQESLPLEDDMELGQAVMVDISQPTMQMRPSKNHGANLCHGSQTVIVIHCNGNHRFIMVTSCLIRAGML